MPDIETVSEPIIAYREFKVSMRRMLWHSEPDWRLVGARNHAWGSETMAAVCEQTLMPSVYCYEDDRIGAALHDNFYCGFYGFLEPVNAFGYLLPSLMFSGDAFTALAEVYYYGIVRVHQLGVSATNARIKRLWLYRDRPIPDETVIALRCRYPNVDIEISTLQEVKDFVTALVQEKVKK